MEGDHRPCRRHEQRRDDERPGHPIAPCLYTQCQTGRDHRHVGEQKRDEGKAATLTVRPPEEREREHRDKPEADPEADDGEPLVEAIARHDLLNFL